MNETNIYDTNGTEEMSLLNLALDSSYLKYGITIVWSLLVVFGVLGNGMVIYIALAYRKLNDVTNCYIFNLAIMDLLFITFCIPFTIYMYTNSSWLFGVTFCKLNHFMSHASVQATCLTLTAMTIHRCNLIIQNKLLAQNAASTSKSRQTVLLVTSIIWLVSFLLSSPDLIFYTALDDFDPDSNETYISCSINKELPTFKYYKYSHFVSIGTSYLVPLLVIVLSYGRLLSHLSANQRRLARFKQASSIKSKQSSARMTEAHNELEQQGIPLVPLASGQQVDSSAGATTPSAAAQKKSSPFKRPPTGSESRKKKVTTMVAVVTLNFGICWFPTHLFIILRALIESHDPNVFSYLHAFKLVAHTLSYLTPVINPILYAFYNENFLLPLQDIWAKVTCRSTKAAAAAQATNHQRKSAKIASP